ncbi:MAG: L-2-amino-thiazoline-4-carboxylic acid hydrolase [Lachnospiraceae bacterium]|nr:L-2-amino-thiazoline-4-carboxylic acid hydrolase [Lachnospiraceae bacterium]
MHEYYARKAPKLKKAMNGFLKPIASELEQRSGKSYAVLFEEIWDHYEKNMLENFPYIGGDTVSGTSNLTGAYCFVSMGEVLKRYGNSLEEIGHLMVLAYERKFNGMPGIVKAIAHKSFTNVKSLNRKYQKKDAQNEANAVKNPGSFETKTVIPPEEGYDFSYHNLVCPLSNFAKAYGYEEYMPYLCNLDYVMFGVFGVPLFREHTCFEDGDYCDFKLKMDAKPMEYWPPVFEQGKGYK